MKHSIISTLSLFMFIVLALPMQSFGMFTWFTCGCGSKRQSVYYKQLPIDEYKIQERQSECCVQPQSLVDTVKESLPREFMTELLELVLAYRSLEKKNAYVISDIYSSVKEIPGQKLELQSSDEEKQAVELYDIETGKKLEAYQQSSVAMQGDAPKVQIRLSNSVGTIDLSNGGRVIFCADGTIKVFNEDGGLQQTLVERHLFRSTIDERLMAPLADGGFVLAVPTKYDHYVIKQWNVGQPTLQTPIEINQPVYSIAEYHKGFLAVSVSFKEVMLFNLRTGEKIGSLAGDSRHETDLVPLSGGRLLTYETHAGYDARTEFKVWE